MYRQFFSGQWIWHARAFRGGRKNNDMNVVRVIFHTYLYTYIYIFISIYARLSPCFSKHGVRWSRVPCLWAKWSRECDFEPWSQAITSNSFGWAISAHRGSAAGWEHPFRGHSFLEPGGPRRPDFRYLREFGFPLLLDVFRAKDPCWVSVCQFSLFFVTRLAGQHAQGGWGDSSARQDNPKRRDGSGCMSGIGGVLKRPSWPRQWPRTRLELWILGHLHTSEHASDLKSSDLAIAAQFWMSNWSRKQPRNWDCAIFAEFWEFQVALLLGVCEGPIFWEYPSRSEVQTARYSHSFEPAKLEQKC